MAFRIIFLGTGGGRHTTMYQARCTGGMLMEHDGGRLHVDPGPGALTQMNRIHYDLTGTTSVIVSHAHPDHYSDAECVVEGMTLGGWKRRGHLYGSPTVIDGDGGLGPCISRYHLEIVGKVTVITPGDVLDIDGLRTEICRAKHSDPTNVGFRFITDSGIVSYVSDTEYSDYLADQYIGSRVLILPVTTPDSIRIPFHLCTEDANRFISRVRPELAIFTHLGMVMIRKGPEYQAAVSEKITGVKTVAATDRMIVDVDDDISLSVSEAYDDGWIPDSSV